MSSSRRLSSPSRLVARGRWSNFLLFIAIVVGGYLGYMYLSPRLIAYEASSAIKHACAGYMRIFLYNESEERWRRDFLSRIRRIGIPLNDDQWAFSTDGACTHTKCRCLAQAAFALTTEWPYLADFFPELKSYRTVHRIDAEVDYRTTW